MIDAVKETLSINKVVGRKTFQITVTGDSIIPDVKPDILSEIATSGNVCVYKKEILENKIRLDGNVNIYLMYLADGETEGIRAFNTSIDFTEILDFAGVDGQMNLDEKVIIKKIECKILNGRKVSFKIMLEVEANVFMNEREQMIKEIMGVDDLQTQVVSLKINSLIGQNLAKASAKETITVDSTDNVAEILAVSFNLINKDTKVSYNKVLAKADVAVKIIYLTDERFNKKSI